MKMGSEFWAAHVAAVKLETISASEYARRHGLSVAALYYWQRKLKSNAEMSEAHAYLKSVPMLPERKLKAAKSLLETLSPWHMPRSVMVFQAAGFDVTPSPLPHYIVGQSWLVLDAESLIGTRNVMHELIDLLWYRLRN